MVARQDGDVNVGVGLPLASEINIPPLRPIENMLITHKRFKIMGICLLNTNRKPSSPDKMATSFLCGTPPLAAEINILPLQPIENMLINCKRFKIDGACLLKTNRKPWSPDTVVTSFVVWDALSGLN